MENPIVAEFLDNLLARLHDVGFVQGLLDRVRADFVQNTAHLAVAVGRFEEVRRCVEKVHASRMPAEQKQAALAELVELAAGIEEHIKVILEHRQQLCRALGVLVAARAIASGRSRASLLPRVLLATAAAAVVVYAASRGGVVPGLRSLVRISYLVLCFLLGA